MAAIRIALGRPFRFDFNFLSLHRRSEPFGDFFGGKMNYLRFLGKIWGASEIRERSFRCLFWLGFVHMDKLYKRIRLHLYNVFPYVKG
jgi:hypothetical protein